MAKFNTQNKLGSTDPRDLLDNSQIADNYVNNNEVESVPDRFGVLRKTWFGMESIFNRLIALFKSRGDAAISAIGWQELGNWSVGLTLKDRRQIVLYNGAWYKYLGALDHTITGRSPSDDGGIWSTDNPSGVWVNIGDSALRQEFHDLQGLYSDLRKYQGDWQIFECLGCESIFDGGHGSFVLDPLDTTTVDNGCTVIVDASNRRWKRKFDGNIQAKWAGIQYVDETDEPQDNAFSNLLLACAVDSPSGYPNKIIEDLSGRRIRISKRFFIRGGVYNNNDTIGNTLHNRSSRFGIDASFVLDGSGGFVLLQMINPKISLNVDNSGVVLAKTPTIDDYALRCECLVISPDIDVKVGQYTGTAYYQLGKYRTTDEFSSMWSDLTLGATANYGGMTNLNGGSFNIGTCGRAFYWKAGGAGFGHLDSVWKQNCANPSYYYDLQDFTFQSFETYLATRTSDSIAKDGDLFEQCGGHFDKLLTGQGGYPNLAFINGSSADIGHLFLVCGSAQGTKDNVNQTGLEVHNSALHIDSAQIHHPNGRGMVIGGSSAVNIGHLYGTFPWQCAALGNEYITTVAGVNSTQCTPRLIVKSFAVVRGNQAAWVNSSRPQFEIGATVQKGGQLALINGKFENIGNGFSSQDDLYAIKCLSDAPGVLKLENVTPPSGIAYPVYLTNPDNLVGFRDNAFDNAKLFVAGGVTSNFGGREMPASSFVTYFNGLTVGGSFQYWGRTPLRFTCRVTVTVATGLSILINGREVFYANEAGHYSFECQLYYGDLLSCTGTAANATISGASITYVRNIY